MKLSFKFSVSLTYKAVLATQTLPSVPNIAFSTSNLENLKPDRKRTGFWHRKQIPREHYVTSRKNVPYRQI